MKNYGGTALKYNPKRGTPEEFEKRDELIGQVVPDVPERSAPEGELSPNGKRRRGRPRKIRYMPGTLDETGFNINESVVEQQQPHSTPRTGRHTAAHAAASGSGTKRKPGRPRKIPNTPAPNTFLDGTELADYMEAVRPRTRQRHRDESVVGEAPATSTPIGKKTSAFFNKKVPINCAVTLM